MVAALGPCLKAVAALGPPQLLGIYLQLPPLAVLPHRCWLPAAEGLAGLRWAMAVAARRGGAATLGSKFQAPIKGLRCAAVPGMRLMWGRQAAEAMHLAMAGRRIRMRQGNEMRKQGLQGIESTTATIKGGFWQKYWGATAKMLLRGEALPSCTLPLYQCPAGTACAPAYAYRRLRRATLAPPAAGAGRRRPPPAGAPSVAPPPAPCSQSDTRAQGIIGTPQLFTN